MLILACEVIVQPLNYDFKTHTLLNYIFISRAPCTCAVYTLDEDRRIKIRPTENPPYYEKASNNRHNFGPHILAYEWTPSLLLPSILNSLLTFQVCSSTFMCRLLLTSRKLSIVVKYVVRGTLP